MYWALQPGQGGVLDLRLAVGEGGLQGVLALFPGFLYALLMYLHSAYAYCVVLANQLTGLPCVCLSPVQAEYDAQRGEFVITTPSNEASKYWIGGSGQHGKVRGRGQPEQA
jgi:hypothetical protein